MKVDVDDFGSMSFRYISEGDPLPPETLPQLRSSLSLEDIYRAQAPRLLRFFGRKGARQDANDLMQEAFVKFADADRRSAIPIEEPAAYLTQVATNLLRNRARSAFQRATAPADPPAGELRASTDLVAVLEARDMLNRLQTAMQRLSPKTREIFMAHRLDGATYAQIAERTGLSVKTVEWHMSKAIARLHRAVGDRR